MSKSKIIIFFIFCCLVSSIWAQFNLEEFRNPAKYGWENLQERQESRAELISRQKLLQIYEMKKLPIWRNMLQSSLIPGWGQFNTKHYSKGQIFMGIELVLIGTSYYYYDQSEEKYQQYLDSSYIGDIKQNYEDASKLRRFSQGFLAVASLVWIYNLYDTYQSTEEYNAGLWDNMIREYHQDNFQISVYPLGIQMRF
jgi:hypothetical protein